MKIIDPNKFYELLITTGDISLFAFNEYLDENNNLKTKLDLQIFNKSGEWLENQINEFNTEDDVEEISYGNLSYLGTVLDDTSYVLPQYTELFKLEVIAFEKDRENVIKLFDDYATNLNNYQTEMTVKDENDEDHINDVYITLGEFSTPSYGETQDIAGAERFLVSLSILVRVSSHVMTTKNIVLEVLNDEGDYEKINYVSFKMKRDTDVILNNSSGYEKKYDVNKTDLTVSMGLLYLDDYISRKAFEYLLTPEAMENFLTLRYTDNLLKISKEYSLYIVGIDPNIQYGSPINYVISLKPINE